MFNVVTDWVLNAVRIIFATIDVVIYSVISFLFRAVFNIANFELVGFYESFEERVYVILGIFMLFKVTISMISYLVNPDKISDKEQGVSKIVVRIITVLIMLIALPTFFDLMTEAQNKLLPVIPRVIVGTANTLSSEDASGIADNMAVTMLQGFIHLRDGCQGSPISSPADILANINNTCSDTDNTYAYDYLPIVSTIVGLAMCYVVFSLCISVAIRAFKLIILRMMAPIPIISYIDPKSAKDGAFSHWTKTFISTWSELFVNIGLIYFIVYIIDFILSGDAWTGFFDGISGEYAFIDGTILLAFVIIGLLFFAKSAPQFVFDALGIKNKGGFMRMLGYGAAAAGIGGNIATGLKTRKDYNEANPLVLTGSKFKDFGNQAKRIASTYGGSLFSGLASSMEAGNAVYRSDKPNLKTGIDAQSKYNAQMINRINSGSTMSGRTKSLLFGTVTGQTPADVMRLQNKSLETAEKGFKNLKSVIESRFDGNDDYIYTFKDESSGKLWTGNYNVLSRTVAAAQSGDSDAMAWLQSNGISAQWFNENQDAIHKAGYKSFAKDTIKIDESTGKPNVADSVVFGAVEELKSDIKGIKVNKYDEYGRLETDANDNPISIDLSSLDFSDYGKVIKPTIGSISGTKRDLVKSDKYKAAMADEKESKK